MQRMHRGTGLAVARGGAGCQAFARLLRIRSLATRASVDVSGENEIRVHLEGLVDPNAGSLATLMTSLQQELRQIARRQRRRGMAGETLSTTALVNEAWLKLSGTPDLVEQIDHRHFLALAARAMRYIVINHARDRVADKRGGGAVHVPLDEALDDGRDTAEAVRLLELDDALQQLERARPRLAQVVHLRYFAGLTEEEIGEVLGIDRSTVRRDWIKARGWLHKRRDPDAAG